MSERPWTREHHDPIWHYPERPDGVLMRCGVSIGGSPFVTERLPTEDYLCLICAFRTNPLEVVEALGMEIHHEIDVRRKLP